MTAKSDRAKELLSDPLLQESLSNLRDEYRKVLGNPDVTDQDILDVHRMLLLTRRFEKHLENIIRDGELEDFRAQEQERPSFLGDISKWQRKH